MPEGISVIIPATHADYKLNALLVSIAAQDFARVETIVVGPPKCTLNDPIPDLTVIPSKSDRSAARNTGASAASNDVFLFLDSDMIMSQGVLSECWEKIQLHDALMIREVTIPGPGYLSRARAFERDSWFGSRWFESARCLQKSIFERMGGYDPRMTGLEDIDLQSRLIDSGARLGWVHRHVWHDERDLTFGDYLRKRSAYAMADSEFERRHPSHWKKLHSPWSRSASWLDRLTISDQLGLIWLAPGAILVRMAELVTRSGDNVSKTKLVV